MPSCQACRQEQATPHLLTGGIQVHLCDSCLGVIRSGRAVTVTLKESYAKRDPESGYVPDWNITEEQWYELPPAWRHVVKTTVRVTSGLLE